MIDGKTLFASTSPMRGAYKFLVRSFQKHTETKTKTKTNFYLLRKQNIYPLKFLNFLVVNSLIGNFSSKKKIVKIKYKECEIGRHVIASYFRINLFCLF